MLKNNYRLINKNKIFINNRYTTILNNGITEFK